jgi:Acyltransferase family
LESSCCSKSVFYRLSERKTRSSFWRNIFLRLQFDARKGTMERPAANGVPMKFRDDINALRALAVIAVVLFHYKVNFIRGGFVGVDIFFVISGYLMTTIITGRLAKGSFSIWEFYGDRAKRIVPGLLGLCFGLLATGYFVLDPFTYQTLGSATTSALLFVSNFQFWEGTSYFNPESANSWLLHSWSLSKSRPDLNTLGSGVEAVITEAISLCGPGTDWCSHRFRCPRHGGRSLVLRHGASGQLLATCWGGCDHLDVLAELREGAGC